MGEGDKMIYLGEAEQKFLYFMGYDKMSWKEMDKLCGKRGKASRKIIKDLMAHGYVNLTYSNSEKYYQRTCPVRLPVLSAKGELVAYFIQSDSNGLIKIGSTNNLSSRYDQLRAGSPVGLKLLNYMVGDHEFNLHIKFDDSRHHDEWFSPTPELVGFVNTLEPIRTHII